jgi:LCP family protein required for cell wall assembly
VTTYADRSGRVRRRLPSNRPRIEEPEPPKRRDPLWAKLCLIIGSIVMVISGAVVVLPRVIANWATGGIPQAPLIPPDLGANIDGPINLLMIGTDERSAQPTHQILSDTIIIAHIPATHDKVFLISLPRDLYVEIPPFPRTNFGGQGDKLNAAFGFGAKDANGNPDNSADGRMLGANLLMQTVNSIVPGGLKFSGAAIVNFNGFKAVLEAIDGVHLCVDEETRSIHFDKFGKYHTEKVAWENRRIYEKGCRDFTPGEALDFSRQRYELNGGDYARQRHQQQLLMAMFKKLMSAGTLTDISKVSKLIDAAKGLLTLDLGQAAVADWVYTLKGIRANDVVMIKTNGGKINSIPVGSGTAEALSETSKQMLQALRDDSLEEFVRAHPDWVAAEK